MSDATYLNSNEGRMFAVLLGGKGALAHEHERRTYYRLARAIHRSQSDWVATSIEAQEAASDFLYRHGARAARSYARALERATPQDAT